MIYFLAGPDTVSLRSFLLNLRKDYPDQITIDGRRQTVKSLNLPSEENLFGDKRLIIIENFTPKEAEPFEQLSSLDIAILNDEIIPAPSWVNKSWFFKQPEALSNFKLADQTVSFQEKSALFTLKKLLAQRTPSELIIGSLVRQFRLISLALGDELTAVSKSSFVQSKTMDQAKRWSKSQIKKALLLILKTDFEIKNGLLDSETSLTILVSKLCRLQT